jgi:type I restriction enzyme M protein
MRHIIALIVELVDPQPGERMCDPAVGTAGFAIGFYQHILRRHTSKAELARGRVTGDLLKPAQWKFLEEQAITGFDNDANMVKIAILNLYLHQLQKANIQHFNPLTTSLPGPYPGQLYNVMLANPPFAGKIQQESILADLNLDTRSTELLFLKWFIDHLASEGRAGVIVPNGVLFGSTKAARKVRELLLTECELQAVVNLPSGVFKPYSGVGTAVLIFKKLTAPSGWTHPRSSKAVPGRADGFANPSGADKYVWFYDLTADGFSLDDKRTPIEANDIPDVIAKWPDREEGPNSYRVPLAKIVESEDLSLAAGRYKPVKVEAANHDDPAEILEEVLAIEKDIAAKAKALLGKIEK